MILPATTTTEIQYYNTGKCAPPVLPGRRRTRFHRAKQRDRVRMLNLFHHSADHSVEPSSLNHSHSLSVRLS